MASLTRPREPGSSVNVSGLRPMDPARDLQGIAHVIEVAFADELSPGGHVIMRDLRLLHTMRPFIWLFSRAMPSFRDYMAGYVWEEEGRVIANTTVSRIEGPSTQWIISNVAVLPGYRRRGIARKLVEAAVEHAQAMHGTRILLQVRSDNDGARTLYQTMNFRYLESITEMLADQVRRSHLAGPPQVSVREPVAERWYEAYELARSTIPHAVQQIRPLRPHAFRIKERSTWQKVRALILVPPRERWWAEYEGRLLGLLTIDRHASRASTQVELLLAPQGLNTVEEALVNQLSARLQGHSGVRVSLPADLSRARALLPEAGFREIRTLDQMALEL